MVGWVIISVLVLLQALQGTPSYLLGDGSLLLRASTYSLFHGNWLHLAVNCIALWSIFVRSRKRYPCKPCRDLLIPYIIAMAVYPLAGRPIAGFSNVIYAVIGIRTPSLRSPWWRSAPVVIFLSVTLLMGLMPQFSTRTHLAAFALGVLCAAARRTHKKILRDAGRYL